MKWPISIGQRDRSHQYDKFVVPLSDEEKIELTQKFHMKCQKRLNKACQNIEKALKQYSRSPFGDETAISDLAKQRKKLFDLKESIKKRTFNCLPYVDLNKEKTNDKAFLDSYPRISLRGKLLMCAIGLDMIFFGATILYDSFFFIPATIITASLLVYLYLRINRRKKTLKRSKKDGSEVW